MSPLDFFVSSELSERRDELIGVGVLTGLVLLWSEDLLDNREESFSLFNTDDELSANVDDDDPLVTELENPGNNG